MKRIKNYILLSLTLFVAALNFNYLLHPLNLVTGGTQGMALVFHAFIPIPFSILILIINILTLILSYFTLSKSTTYGTLVATFVYPLCVHLASLLPEISLNEEALLIYSLLAGVVCGLTGGYVYRLGFSSGGVNTLNLWIQKYLHIKVSLSNFIINATIILLGVLFFGVEKGFYSILVILVSSLVIDHMVKKSPFAS